MISKSFDHLARVYQPLEYVTMGRALQRVRCRHLPALGHQRRVLIVGEGDGRFLERLLASNARCHATVVEGSQAMIERARRRARPHGASRVAFIQRDALEACAELHEQGQRFDTVVTLFVLDCFEGRELAALVAQLGSLLRNGGLWVYGDFALPSTGVSRTWARAWVALLYRAFGWVTDIRARRLEDPDPLLSQLGLERLSEQLEASGLLRSALWRKHAAPAG